MLQRSNEFVHLYCNDPVFFFTYIATPCCSLPGDPLLDSRTWLQGLRLYQRFVLKNSTTKWIFFTRWSKLFPIITLIRSKVETQHLALTLVLALFQLRPKVRCCRLMALTRPPPPAIFKQRLLLISPCLARGGWSSSTAWFGWNELFIYMNPVIAKLLISPMTDYHHHQLSSKE